MPRSVRCASWKAVKSRRRSSFREVWDSAALTGPAPRLYASHAARRADAPPFWRGPLAGRSGRTSPARRKMRSRRWRGPHCGRPSWTGRPRRARALLSEARPCRRNARPRARAALHRQTELRREEACLDRGLLAIPGAPLPQAVASPSHTRSAGLRPALRRCGPRWGGGAFTRAFGDDPRRNGGAAEHPAVRRVLHEAAAVAAPGRRGLAAAAAPSFRKRRRARRARRIPRAPTASPRPCPAAPAARRRPCAACAQRGHRTPSRTRTRCVSSTYCPWTAATFRGRGAFPPPPRDQSPAGRHRSAGPLPGAGAQPTAIRRGFASAVLGSVSVSTPSSSCAPMRSWSTLSDSENDRA